MNQKGFSLVSAMVSVVVAGAAILTYLAIIRSITATLNLSNAQYEVGNQLFEVKSALTDPATCIANFPGVNFSSGTVGVAGPLRPLSPSGTGLNPAMTLLPNVGAQPGVRAYVARIRIYRNPAVPTVAELMLEFSSASFPTGSISRNVPLNVTVDGTGLMTACTAGSGSLLSTLPPGDGVICDSDTAPTPASLPSLASRQQVRSKVCSGMTFPTAATHGELSCALFAKIISEAAASDGNKQHMAGMTVIPNPGCYVGSAASTGVTGVGTAAIREFANLQSLEDCLAKPYFPEGTMITGSAIFTGDSRYACLNGRWIMTQSLPSAAAGAPGN